MGKKTNYNSYLIELLGEKPVAFNRALARIANGATAGLFMSQLLYWFDKGKYEGWVYKTIEDFKDETCLTRSEQDRAIEKWKRLGVLEVRLKGIPRRRFFHINFEALVSLLTSSDESISTRTSAHRSAVNSKLDCRSEHAITESTSKKTNKDVVLTERASMQSIAAERKALTKKFSIPFDCHE